MTRSTFALVALATLASLATACSGAVQSPQSTEQAAQVSSALDADNGGYTTSNEAPAFGDPEVSALADFETTYADPTDETAAALAVPGATLYHLALVWGHLPIGGDSATEDPAPTAINWTGSVSVDAGAIGVMRTLAFDPGDHVDPRVSPSVVRFVSHTLPATDGLFLHVVIPPGGSTALHFQTVALTTDIDLASLATKDNGFDRLDDRNAVEWVGYPDVAGCARGILLGRWTRVVPELGLLRGRVVDGDGATLGHVKGVWGHAPKRNEDVFFGKYIDLLGAFHGLFGGTYGAGNFQGVWGTIDPLNAGTLEGVYSAANDVDDDSGEFLGRWSERCQ